MGKSYGKNICELPRRITSNASQVCKMLGRETTANLSDLSHHGEATEKQEGGRTEKEEELTEAYAAAV
jgi:hypothetical protein